MAKKDMTRTPRSRVKNALRMLWLRSRERSYAIKLGGRCCEICGAQQSQAKGMELSLEVHHRHGINWDQIVDLVIERVLQRPEDLMPVCKPCHEKMTEVQTQEREKLAKWKAL